MDWVASSQVNSHGKNHSRMFSRYQKLHIAEQYSRGYRNSFSTKGATKYGVGLTLYFELIVCLLFSFMLSRPDSVV